MISVEQQLQAAVFKRRTGEVKKILDENNIDVNQKLTYHNGGRFTCFSWTQWSLLAYAVYHLYFDIARLLLEKGANSNEKIPDGLYKDWTLLSYAVYKLNLNLTELLLKYGANLDLSLQMPASTINCYRLRNQKNTNLVKYAHLNAKSIANALVKHVLKKIINKVIFEPPNQEGYLSKYKNYFNEDNNFFEHPKAYQFYNQAIFDVAIMRTTLLDDRYQNEDNNLTRLLLKKIYYLIHRAGLYVRGNKKGEWYPWKKCGLPLATVLCRGSKILIQLPKNCDRNLRIQFEEWLSLFQRYKRIAASHDIEELKSEETERVCYQPPIKKLKWLRENKIVSISGDGFKHGTKSAAGYTLDAAKQGTAYLMKGASYLMGSLGLGKPVTGKEAENVRAPNTCHFGFDLPLGGFGNRNPLNYDQDHNLVMNNGSHGHLYICRPTNIKENSPGILITIEPSAPGFTGQNGHTHDLSAQSSHQGVNGGCLFGDVEGKHKNKGMFDIYQKGPSTYHDGLFVDISSERDLSSIISDFSQNLDLNFIFEFPEEGEYLL